MSKLNGVKAMVEIGKLIAETVRIGTDAAKTMDEMKRKEKIRELEEEIRRLKKEIEDFKKETSDVTWNTI